MQDNPNFDPNKPESDANPKQIKMYSGANPYKDSIDADNQ